MNKRHAQWGLKLTALSLSWVLSSCAINPPEALLVSSDEENTISTLGTVTTTPTSEPGLRKNNTSINIAVEKMPASFNPHIRTGDTMLSRVVASMVLPSAFNNGVMNTDLLLSAEIIPVKDSSIRDEITGQVVRYIINPSAQWSDGTPITGSDFAFLWRNMISSADTINPAGYFFIDKIQTSADGRTVDVHFTTTYTEWNSLFNNLLPSHSFRSTPSFSRMLEKDIPVSGGQYQFSGIDNLNVLTLQRNDRFWGNSPAKNEQIFFRAVETDDRMLMLLNNKTVDFIDSNLVTGIDTKLRKYSSIQTENINTERTLNIIFNQNSTLLTTAAARAGVASRINFDQIYSSVINSDYQEDLPERPVIPDNMEEYNRSVRPLMIAADSNNPLSMDIAQALVSSFHVQGYSARIMDSAEDEEDFNQSLATGAIDILIAWQKIPTTITELASRYGCSSHNEMRSDNLSGFCDSTVQSILDEALQHGNDVDSVQEQIENRIESSVVSFPLVHDMHAQAVGEYLIGPSSVFSYWRRDSNIGFFSTMPMWTTRNESEE